MLLRKVPSHQYTEKREDDDDDDDKKIKKCACSAHTHTHAQISTYSHTHRRKQASERAPTHIHLSIVSCSCRLSSGFIALPSIPPLASSPDSQSLLLSLALARSLTLGMFLLLTHFYALLRAEHYNLVIRFVVQWNVTLLTYLDQF